MSEEHTFELEASWSGGLAGRGHVRAGALDADVSLPSAFGGTGRGTNPEELLIGAASSCYLLTLAAICQRRELPVTTIALTSEVRVTSPPALKVLSVIHRPVLSHAGGADEATRAALLDAAHRAEALCMVSSAMRGNVDVRVEPTITGRE
jgi:peroxiredoxin-like protein